MRTADGGTASPISDAAVNVLVFFRPQQERSAQGLRDLAQCQRSLSGKPVRWVAIVSGSADAQAAGAMVHGSGFAAPLLVDDGDSLYGSLGIATHPVVALVGADRKLAAFEVFRSLDFCAIVAARIRFALREIDAAQLREALEPPRPVDGDAQAAARRWHAMALAQQRAGQLDKACESVRRSLERDPAFAPARELAQARCHSDSK